MPRFAIVALIVEGEYLARFLPVQGERDGRIRQERRLEFDVLNAVEPPAWRQ